MTLDAMAGTESRSIELVRAHAVACWPERRIDVVRWTGAGLVENIAELGVVRVSAEPQRAASWIYISAGASAEPLEDGYGIEFFLLAPADEPLAVRLVAMVAQLHADPRYPLSLGQVVEIGQPWLPGASCDHLLVCLPDPFGPELEWYSDRERTIRFVWLVPITAREAALVKSQGFQVLQQQLGASGVDLSQPRRASVV